MVEKPEGARPLALPAGESVGADAAEGGVSCVLQQVTSPPCAGPAVYVCIVYVRTIHVCTLYTCHPAQHGLHLVFAVWD